MSYFLVPSSPPATVVAVSISPSTIQVAWDEVPERDRNGIITMYEIQYWKSGNQANRNNVTVGTDDLLHELEMLEDFQSYFIRVRAYTVVGAGPYSEPVTAQADQQGNCFTQHCVHRNILPLLFTSHMCFPAPSGPPLNVTSQTLSSSSILVTWDKVPAVQRNGIITKYEVEYNHTAYSSSDSSTQTKNTSDTMIVLVNLHEYTEYLIHVRAYTSVGHGPFSNQTVSTTQQDSKLCCIKYCTFVKSFCYFRTRYTSRESKSLLSLLYLSQCLLGLCTTSSSKWNHHQLSSGVQPNNILYSNQKQFNHSGCWKYVCDTQESRGICPILCESQGIHRYWSWRLLFTSGADNTARWYKLQ